MKTAQLHRTPARFDRGAQSRRIIRRRSPVIRVEHGLSSDARRVLLSLEIAISPYLYMCYDKTSISAKAFLFFGYGWNSIRFAYTQSLSFYSPFHLFTIPARRMAWDPPTALRVDMFPLFPLSSTLHFDIALLRLSIG